MTLIVIFSPSVPKLFDPQEDSNVRRSFVIYRLQYKSMTEVPTKWPPFCRRHCQCIPLWLYHYGDVIMGTLASQITSLTNVYSTVYSDTDHRKHQSSASLAFVWGIHRGPVNSPHKWPVTRKMLPFDYVIMFYTTFRDWSFFWSVKQKISQLWF